MNDLSLPIMKNLQFTAGSKKIIQESENYVLEGLYYVVSTVRLNVHNSAHIVERGKLCSKDFCSKAKLQGGNAIKILLSSTQKQL